jgi:hypothetical protein
MSWVLWLIFEWLPSESLGRRGEELGEWWVERVLALHFLPDRAVVGANEIVDEELELSVSMSGVFALEILFESGEVAAEGVAA